MRTFNHYLMRELEASILAISNRMRMMPSLQVFPLPTSALVLDLFILFSCPIARKVFKTGLCARSMMCPIFVLSCRYRGRLR
ncbi:hypothetical protein POSPLADRAFT_1040990 [Postia placenta MAD-698-R-SB12]|uniref:Uncharacterized protein n=1 Tax=Postia placenta MAD-698-R-SB12 TaxID=670580 RepID=A0A1X6MSK1_9APHY|nr:hypothetical protein POSPLADRAFT_1040990 [Postia placenta MAD-698-R-SB12]OSX59365.1 hypothetical protein POSPLADRAFT_1040990 [Postia placenta MAD-698-R-SB12]